MSVLSSVLGGASVVGFSGSRSVSPPSSVVAAVVAAVPPSAALFVGCASGADSVFRSAFAGRVSVLSASSFGSGRGAFAARSVACVRRCLGGVWVSFPASPCPAGLVPSASSSACFCGLGSGSWASLAFAAGLGLSCLVWLPAGVPAPAWLRSVGGGWWVLAPAPSQLSLF